MSVKYRDRVKNIENHVVSTIDTIGDNEDTYARYLGMVSVSDYCIVNFRNSYHCRLLLEHALKKENEIILVKPNCCMFVLGNDS